MMYGLTKRRLLMICIPIVVMIGIAQTPIPSGGLDILNAAGTAVTQLFDDGDATFGGDVIADSFTGDGSGLTGVGGSFTSADITGKTQVTPVATDFIIGTDASDGDALKKFDIADILGAGGGITDGATLSSGLTFPNTGLHILDTNDSHDLILRNNFDMTADRTLNIVTGDTDRTITLNGDTTLSGTNTGDQTITLTGDVTGTGTGSFGTTIAAGSVDIAMLSASGTPSSSTYLRGDNSWQTVSGSGDVVGPASATDNAVVRFDLTTGKLIQDSVVTIADTTGNMAGVGTLNTHTIPGGTGTFALTSGLHAAVTVSGSYDYFTLSGQDLVRGQIDLTTDVTGELPDANVSNTLQSSLFVGSGSTTNAIDLATAEVAGTLPAGSVGTGLTDAQVSDTLTASLFVGTGSSTTAVDLATAEVSGELADANVSNTLQSSLFVGSGSTTNAIDLATAEVAGTLPDGNVSDTLTSSLFVGSGSTTSAIDLATAEVAGDLPLANIAQFGQATIAGRNTGAGTGDLTALTLSQFWDTASETTVGVTSTSNSVAWNSDNAIYFTHTLSQNTTIAAGSGTERELQSVVFVITQAAGTYTLAWNAEFIAGTDFADTIPAIGTLTGDVGVYMFKWFPSPTSKWVLWAHTAI